MKSVDELGIVSLSLKFISISYPSLLIDVQVKDMRLLTKSIFYTKQSN